jgi:hypothetical protein
MVTEAPPVFATVIAPVMCEAEEPMVRFVDVEPPKVRAALPIIPLVEKTTLPFANTVPVFNEVVGPEEVLFKVSTPLTVMVPTRVVVPV